MDELQQTKTVAVKACAACSSGLLEHDKFCRWCGARQLDQEALELNRAREMSVAAGGCSAPSYVTVPLTVSARAEVYRQISGPLVNAVASGALAGQTENQSPFVKRLILALISIPIWLIIVLLSPLDAYAAVKNLARQA